MGAVTFTITYFGGDGNEVVLTADVSYVWSGASNDGREWSIGGNWVGGVAPTPNSDLIFPANPVRTESLNDFSTGTAFHSILIAGAGYDIYGNGIGLTDGIDATYGAGSSSFALDFQLLVNQTVSAGAGGLLELGGAISSACDESLTLAGLGTIRLSGAGANTYGNTHSDVALLLLAKTPGVNAIPNYLYLGDLASATVRLEASDQLDDLGIGYLYGGSVLDLNGFDERIRNIEMYGAVIEVPTGSALTFSGYVSANEAVNGEASEIRGAGVLDLDGNAAAGIYAEDHAVLDVEFRISAVIVNGGVFKRYAGTVALSAVNTYDGETVVDEGVIMVENDSALGSTLGGTDVQYGAAVVFLGQSRAIAENFLISSDGNDDFKALYNLATSTTMTGVIDVDGDSEIGTADGTTFRFDGVFFDDGYSEVEVHNGPTGRVIVAGENVNFDGYFRVYSGILQVASNNAFGISVHYDPHFYDGATMEIAGGVDVPAIQVIGLYGAPAAGSAKLVNVSGNNSVANRIIFLDRFQSIDVAAGTTLTLSGEIAGTEALDKNGEGALVLSGVSTLTGQVNAYAGTLVVTGNTATSSGTQVTDGGTLAGTGTTSGVFVLAGGTIAPGVEAPGILNAGDLDLALGALYDLDIFGTVLGAEYDQINVTGIVALNDSILSLNFGNGFIATAGQTFTVINNDGIDPMTGTFAGLPEGAIFAYQGQPFQISYEGGTGNDVVLTSVAIQVSPGVLTTPTAGSVYSEQLTAAGGSGTGYSFTATGLPAGLSISPSGLISGTPTTATSVPFTVEVTVTDDIGSVTVQSYVLTVNAMLTISPPTIPSPTLGVPYAQQLTPGGGSGSGYVFTSTALPDGLTLTPDGLISGNVTSTAPVVVIVTLTDGDGATTARTYNITPNAAASTTSLASSTNQTAYGEPVTFTAIVQPADVSFGSPTGTVEFYDGETLLGSAALDQNGVATFVTSTIGTGTRSITATYLGNASYAPSTSAAVTFTVTRSQTTGGTVTTSKSQSNFGQEVVLAATFSATSNNGAPMTGTVDFFDGDTYLGTATMGAPLGMAMLSVATTVTGTAYLSTSSLAVGGHVIRAVYSGDSNYTGASSGTSASVDVEPAVTETHLGAETTESGTVLTAAVVVTSGGRPPVSGSVSFYDGTTLLGTVPLVDGVARYDAGVLPAGAHRFTAVFSGGGSSSGSNDSINVSTDGPQVVSLIRYGIHAMPTRLVLSFNGALDEARAENTSNYQILDARGRRISVRVATYDPATQTVTLSPSSQLSLHQAYTLIVNGATPTGLTGSAGVPLDGSGQNQPGTDYVTTITWRNLGVPGLSPVMPTVSGRFGGFRANVNSFIRRPIFSTSRSVWPSVAVRTAPRAAWSPISFAKSQFRMPARFWRRAR